jgi:hypothetical protein
VKVSGLHFFLLSSALLLSPSTWAIDGPFYDNPPPQICHVDFGGLGDTSDRCGAIITGRSEVLTTSTCGADQKFDQTVKVTCRDGQSFSVAAIRTNQGLLAISVLGILPDPPLEAGSLKDALEKKSPCIVGGFGYHKRDNGFASSLESKFIAGYLRAAVASDVRPNSGSTTVYHSSRITGKWDLGDPLLCKVDGVWKIAGVSEPPTETADRYLDVATFRDWIKPVAAPDSSGAAGGAPSSEAR